MQNPISHTSSYSSSSLLFTSISRASTKHSGQDRTPHLVKRGAYYYYRVAVPKDLKHALPHREIKRSLRTSSLKAARILASAYESETQGLFATLRAKRITGGLVSIPVEVSQVSAVEAPQKEALSLSEAVDKFKEERQQGWTLRTRLEFGNALSLLVDTIGGTKTLSKISRSDCVDCREKLLKKPAGRGGSKSSTRSPKTVNKYLSLLSSVFKWAVAQGLLSKNPCEGLSIALKGKTTEERKAYSEEQLKALKALLPAKDGSRPERYWIPMIALYSGLRLEEIAHLKINDLVKVWGVLCFNIEGSHLKNSSSVRQVPVHPKLVKLGFVDYLESVRGADREGEVYLFSQLTEDGYGRRAKFFGKWFGRFLRGVVKIKDSKITFHSFRHTFATALKHTEVDGPMISELLGHTVKGQTFGRYAKGYPPKMLLEAVMKVEF